MSKLLPLNASVLDALRSRLRGPICIPGDADFDVARRVWNGAIDRRPSCVIGCADAEDVSHAVRIAVDNGLQLTIRGGGHNVAGRSISDGVLLLDLSRLSNGNEFTYSGQRNPIVGSVCVGVWKRTGEHTYVLNHIGLSWNPLAPSISPPGDPAAAGPGNPGGGPGAPGGPAFIKQHIVLAEDRKSYTGTFEITQLLPDGKTPVAPVPIKGRIVATRVTIDTDTQEP